HWASGNICWGSIIVEDKIAPRGELPNLRRACTKPLPAYWTINQLVANRYVYDNCGPLKMTGKSTTTELTNCDEPGVSAKFKRSYTIEDECGNTSVFSHWITLYPEDIEKPDDYTTTCKDADISPNRAGWPTIDGYPLMNGGDKVGYCEWAVDYQDWVIDICLASGSKTVVRTWKCTNICTGDVYKVDQNIYVKDEDPWLLPPDTEALWLGTNNSYECSYYGTLPAPKLKEAVCSEIHSITAAVYQKQSDGYFHPQPVVQGVDILGKDKVRLEYGEFKIEYTVSDVCHGHANLTAEGAVYDNTPPVAVADTETTIDLTPEECEVVLHAEDLDSGSYDNCKLEAIKVARADANGNPIEPFGPYVTFTLADACKSHMVAFRAYDSDKIGEKDVVMYSQVMVMVHVQDNFIALQNLQDKTIDCSGDDDWNADDAFDTPEVYGCTAEIYDVQTTSSILNCGRSTYTRTWYARNCKGLTTTTRQRVHVEYVGSISVKFPKDVTMFCREDGTYDLSPNATGRPVITETGCAVASVSDPVDERFSHDGDDGCFKIFRTWKVLDWCSGEIVDTDVQVIKVVDNVRPIVSASDVDVCITEGCTATFEVPAPTITDCTATTTRVFWEFEGKDGSELSDYVNVGAMVTFGPGKLYLKYEVEDACGNFGNAEAVVTIEDCKNPTIYCRNPIAAPIMNTNGEIAIWASDFLLKAEDNCDTEAMVEATVKMRRHGTTDAPTDAITVTCSELTFAGGFAGLSVDIIVYDWQGNSGFCTVAFQIQDNTNVCGQGAVGGDVASLTTSFNDEVGESVENVKVDLTGGMTITDVTDASGRVLFSVPMHNDYDVEGKKSEGLLNGVTTYDIVVATRHILGITPLTSPYKLIAADVNNTGSVSTGDIVALRRAILAITEEFPNNDSWRFIDEKYTFPQPTNPWLEAFPERVSVADLDHDMNAGFVGIKIGDLNDSATPNELLGSSSPNADAMVIGLEDTELVAGQQYDIQFKARDFNHFGYQFTLGFDQSAISVDDVKAGALEGLSQNNFGMQLLDQGAITTSWDNPNGATLENDKTLFTLSITANTNSRLSEVLNINSTVTSAEAVNSGLEPTDVTLEFFNRASASFELFQNTPNPFSDHTLIQFNLPKADQVQLKIFDVAGKVLHAQTATLDKGTHQIRINKADLGATGVLYYQVETSTDVATKKMISLE
ncbi:MAG: T9SS type A sorting domain-containing protein, partial [Bacteroidia bacterium]|nr:T9SS type A sorting domain-containing protein [Bacteroidia bacterium]